MSSISFLGQSLGLQTIKNLRDAKFNIFDLITVKNEVMKKFTNLKF